MLFSQLMLTQMNVSDKILYTLTMVHPVMRLGIATAVKNPSVDVFQRLLCRSIRSPVLYVTTNCSCNRHHFL